MNFHLNNDENTYFQVSFQYYTGDSHKIDIYGVSDNPNTIYGDLNFSKGEYSGENRNNPTNYVQFAYYTGTNKFYRISTYLNIFLDDNANTTDSGSNQIAFTPKEFVLDWLANDSRRLSVKHLGYEPFMDMDSYEYDFTLSGMCVTTL
jgi:hypothetical protein